MHILATSTATLDDLIEPVDLGQEPADMVALSFADSDLAALAGAWERGRAELPSMRLASLRDLRHPMSVDIWIDKIASHAKIILVRLLGGYDWWSYGCDRLSEIARSRGIHLALLPGECRESDQRLIEKSTLPVKELVLLLSYFREGGPDNMTALLKRLASPTADPDRDLTASPFERVGFYHPDSGVVPIDNFAATSGKAVIPVLFYRSMLMAGDVRPIDELFKTLQRRGFAPVPIFVSSLKDETVAEFVAETAAKLDSAAILATTAFAAGRPGTKIPLFDQIGIPVFQAVVATTRREAWIDGQRGLAPADLAMHVVLPELDGRILAGAISFKDAPAEADELGLRLQVNRPEPDRIEQVVDRIETFLRLRNTPRNERHVAILLPDYPGAEGRTGYAVGLDVPASVIAMLQDLKAAGYTVEDIPRSPRELVKCLSKPQITYRAVEYLNEFNQLSSDVREAVVSSWAGPAEEDHCFRAVHFGNVTVALAPTGAEARIGAPTITIRCCRRATSCSLSVSGCVGIADVRQLFTLARMEPWNGCPARRWHYPPIASPKSSPVACR